MTREYYFNDFGEQVRRLGESVIALRDGRQVADDGYRGDYVAELAAAIPADIAAIRQLPATARSPEQQLTLTAFAVRQLATERLAALPAPRKLYAAATVAQNERGTIRYDKPREIHILTRGDVERPGELVPPGALMAVPELNGRFEIAPDQPESARRAALARWLADPRNPLTWRSIANRVWQHHFGRGLCETSGDFGRMGSTPDHPLLLDWQIGRAHV